MEWEKIAEEKNIEIVYISEEYSEKGSSIPVCDVYPNGAIILSKGLRGREKEIVALHELGHLIYGKSLISIDEKLKVIEHCKNENNANKFLFENKVHDFFVENYYSSNVSSPIRFCEYLNLKSTEENIHIANNVIRNFFKER